MSNQIYIEQVLDDCFRQKLTRTDAAALLRQQGISNAENEIDLHWVTAIALQRYSVVEQVQNVHRQFLQQQSSVDVNKSGAKPKIVKMNIAKWFLRAAAAIILVAGVWYVYQYNNANSTTLYADIYQSYDVNTDRANIEEVSPHNMVEEYKAKNYAAVVTIYQGLATTNNREKFLAAMSYQETGNSAEAIKLLDNILQLNKQQQSRLYNDEAEFYLALNYLKINNTKKATPIFQKIYYDPGHTFHERITKARLRKMKWLN